MATRLFSTVANRVSPNVPGCPTPTIIEYVRRAAIRTCERTAAWRWTPAPYALTAGIHEYAYDVPENAEVHVVFAAIVNGRPLDLLNMEAAIRQYPQWADLFSGEDPSVAWSLTPSSAFNTSEYNEQVFNFGAPYQLPEAIVEDASTPRALTQVTPDRFVILPLPDAENVYTMRMFMALKPLRTATGMDADMLNELEDVIMHGALQDLLIMPNVPWGDRELAAFHAKQHSYQLSERRARASLGNMRGSVTTRMRPFA